MTIDKLIDHNFNKPKDRKREIGKYWASDIFAIRKGYTTTGNFFKQKPIDGYGQLNIFWGNAGEEELGKILKEENADFITQERLKIEIDDFQLTGKTDFSFPAFILETKCPRDFTNEIPEKWCDQLECYHRATGKPVKLGILNKNGNNIINTYSYKPDDSRWQSIQELLREFHAKLLKKNKDD